MSAQEKTIEDNILLTDEYDTIGGYVTHGEYANLSGLYMTARASAHQSLRQEGHHDLPQEDVRVESLDLAAIDGEVRVGYVAKAHVVDGGDAQ